MSASLFDAIADPSRMKLVLASIEAMLKRESEHLESCRDWPAGVRPDQAWMDEQELCVEGLTIAVELMRGKFG